MANTVAPLNPEKWMSDVQDYLNASLVAEKVCHMKKFDGMVSEGDTINFPYINDMRAQTYAQGTDLTIDEFTATQDQLSINRSYAATTPIDPVQVKQAMFKGYPEELARQCAFVLSQELDQRVLGDGVTNAGNSVTGGTLTAATVYTRLTEAMAAIQRANGADGEMFAVLDPERVALLAQSEVANGWNVADRALMNGFVGDSQAGFRIYASNNLPVSNTWNQTTIPTATDTVTLFGVTWTFVANGAATAAGDISIGVNAAAAQANFVLAVNGTGTPGAGTYVDVSTANRRRLQNAQATCGAFATGVATITGYGRINGSETLTATGEGWGTESGTLLCGRRGSVACARQMMPQLYIKDEPKQLTQNYITHHLYGTTVFTRDADRLAGITYNV